MRMIQEQDFEPTISQENWDLQSIVMYVMADWVDGGLDFYDEDVNLSEGYFDIMDGEEKYNLHYSFDVNVTAHAYYRPGTYDSPPEGDNTEYHFDNWKLEITNMETNEVIYNGPDFTNFEGLQLTTKTVKYPNGKTGSKKYFGSDLLYDRFDDTINELDNDNDRW